MQKSLYKEIALHTLNTEYRQRAGKITTIFQIVNTRDVTNYIMANTCVSADAFDWPFLAPAAIGGSGPASRDNYPPVREEDHL